MLEYTHNLWHRLQWIKVVQSEVLIPEVWLQMQDSWKQLERDIREDFSVLYSQVRTVLSMFKYFDKKGTSRKGATKTILNMTHCGWKHI